MKDIAHISHRSAFNDFGSKFTCVDPTGEQPLSGMIVSVEKVRRQSACRKRAILTVLIGFRGPGNLLG